MSRKLEEYLKRERTGLDVELPDDISVWNRIERRLSENQRESGVKAVRTKWIRIRNIAAAAIITFCLGYITNDLIKTFGKGRTVTLSSIDRGLGEREDQYKTMVNIKTAELSMLRGSDNSVVTGLLNELVHLDTMYMQAMADLRVLGPNEKVINTIFDTWEQKIRILELIILETNRINIHENNEKIAI